MVLRISNAAVSILISFTIQAKRTVKAVLVRCSLLHGPALAASNFVTIKQFHRAKMKRRKREKL
jgi:putative exporter of polyketide antibiotics